METINCPICNNDKFTLLFKSRDYLHNIEGEFDIVKCNNCSLVLTNPRPDKNEMIKYYPENYRAYSSDFNKIKFKVEKLRKNKLLCYLRKMLDSKAVVYPRLENSSVLEIGCGGGNFLYRYGLENPTNKIQGVDFNASMINKLKERGLNVSVSDLSTINFPDSQFDLIMGWMVLEHIHDINKALSELHRILKTGGTFCFSIPDINNFIFKIFKDKWYALQAPTHLYHFTSDTIGKLLAKHGFQIKKIIYHRTVVDISNSIYNTMEEGRLKETFKKIGKIEMIIYVLTFPLALILSLFKQTGKMSIVAVKY